MSKVIIIGAGLSGLLASYILKSHSDFDVTIFDKGDSYENRLAQDAPNLISGVGGAGTIGGGKLCFPPASDKIWRKTEMEWSEFSIFEASYLSLANTYQKKAPKFVLDSSLLSNGQKLILKKYQTQLLLKEQMNDFVLSIKNAAESLGVSIRHNSTVTKISTSGVLYKVHYTDNTASQLNIEPCDYLIFASGRSSYNELPQWLSTIIKWNSPDLGLRVTLPYSVDGVNPGDDIKIKAKYRDVSVRTFCVCSGGKETLVRFNDLSYYDGHFGTELLPITNFGILARDAKLTHPDTIMEYCRALAPYIHSNLSLKDFVKYGAKLIKTTKRFDLIIDAIIRFVLHLRATGFLGLNLNMYPVYLPSVDRFNPEIECDRYCETPINNVYVVGDAIGISRGFIQSLWSAYCAANRILVKSGACVDETNLRVAA